jgi:hypothetical protein
MKQKLYFKTDFCKHVGMKKINLLRKNTKKRHKCKKEYKKQKTHLRIQTLEAKSF